MKILHTSDWHLGRSLYGQPRYGEFEAFLNWLLERIREEGVDVLVVAGDVFDTTAPSNRAQQLYYNFLCQVARSACRHVVVVAGNHDSPSFLTAPRELLQALDVHVVGAAAEDPADEVLVLRDGAGAAELIVCAVPYLRDREIRTVEAGESFTDKGRKLVEGIRQHYAQVAAAAQARQQELGGQVPIIATGHLFTSGGLTLDGDGVRELYVGSLAHVPVDLFPSSLSYVALGHLHVPQRVGGRDTVRYSGSPIAMGFGESGQQKSVCLVELSGAASADPGRSDVELRLIPVPVFQAMSRLEGDWPAISRGLNKLIQAGEPVWVEVVLGGDTVVPDVREQLDRYCAGSPVAVLRVKNPRVVAQLTADGEAGPGLAELDVHDVFERCLAAHNVDTAQREELRLAYSEILQSLAETDAAAE